MKATSVYIDGVGLIGPGLPNWPQAAQILTGACAYEHAPAVIPPPAALPSAERRRTSPMVKLALAVGGEAAQDAQRDAAQLGAVFAASGGDGENCHAICEMLAGEDRFISPTRFHNSVHNAPSGYWGIAAHAMAASNVICAYDGSFAAGLLESVCQVAVDARDSLLIASDIGYPHPLSGARSIRDAFGAALVLAPEAGTGTLARIDVQLTDAQATILSSPALEAVRLDNPAARALPLLEALAARRAATVVLDYLDDLRVRVDVTPFTRVASVTSVDTRREPSPQ
ncbi:beta-ketoacyl synthase chain length factor [Trinickia dinghuensis]|uniref:3-oxoacyl-ACP synthase n=1 Tax=Trinickia dinghuensis TaxID=2291023 RepID=A0A3D8JUU6_9BURK|nr:beta-ketoacyl synthase chain length factor [Trinickia dinghuensis]RDU96505.1 3-oxoacyl-ACP synthase [Trinickia dinghuensis]